MLNSGGQITSSSGTSRSQLTGDRSLDVRPDAPVSAAGRSAMVILLGRVGSFVAPGMHIMLRFSRLGRKAPIRRMGVSLVPRVRVAERVSGGGVGHTDRVMLR